MKTAKDSTNSTNDTSMTTSILSDYISVWMEAFIVAKRAGSLSKNTVLFYTRKLKQFDDYCEARAVKQIEQITP